MSSPVRLPTEPRHTRELESLLADLDADSLRWVSGFVAGLAAERSRLGGAPAVVAPAVPVAAAAPVERPRVTVLYASQTGNSRRVAEKLGQALESAGFQKNVVATGDYALKQFADERFLYVVASTHGDGEPPDDARALLDALSGRRAPKLDQLAYAVLGLGDSSYPQFCATARILDERFAELGARRLSERVECDVDFDAKSAAWIQQSVTALNAQLGAHDALVAAGSTEAVAAPAAAAATREAPVEVEVTVNQRITARDADKDVRHVELIVPEGRFAYQAGDALGIWLDNPAALVDETLAASKLDASESVSVDGVTRPLKVWLSQHRELTRVARALVERLAALSGDAGLADLLKPANAARLRAQFKVWQVPDLLQRYAAQWTGERLVRALHPLSPRLYSIASAPEEVGEEVHITVAVVDEVHDGKRHLGAVSSQVQGLEPGARVRAFIEANTRFRLPADPSTSVIMIGPGTGVAPFRGFVQARAAQGAKGRNWLLFGGRHLDQDFLYQTEWLAALKKGALTRLDVAFSRDTAQKVYVQHRLREHGAELFQWLEAGAHVYVCGDAERMAPDVQAALVEIVATHGGRSTQDAEAYVAGLASARRYLRDVY
jgi:sulfite reductase (NADPH) flavoprotein alpha-component